ncbi:MAG: hypothetical protein ACLGI7_10760 [Gammaproteobacteria bacterium]
MSTQPTTRDWLEPPLWWKKWRPLRWLAGGLILFGLYSWLSPLLRSDEPQSERVAAATPVPRATAPAPVAAAEPAPQPTAAPERAAAPAVTAALAAPAAPSATAAEAQVYEEQGEPIATESEMAAFTRVEPDPVRLLGPYRSYLSVDEVVYGLEQAGFSPIIESNHMPVSDDVPPRNLDSIVVNQYRHWEVQGRLELQFFNNRLYQAEFEPDDAELYVRAQRRELPQLRREHAGRSELIDGHLRVASSLDLAVSDVGQKLRTRPFLLWQDRRLVRQRDEWDRRFATAAVR